MDQPFSMKPQTGFVAFSFSVMAGNNIQPSFAKGGGRECGRHFVEPSRRPPRGVVSNHKAHAASRPPLQKNARMGHLPSLWESAKRSRKAGPPAQPNHPLANPIACQNRSKFLLSFGKLVFAYVTLESLAQTMENKGVRMSVDCFRAQDYFPPTISHKATAFE